MPLDLYAAVGLGVQPHSAQTEDAIDFTKVPRHLCRKARKEKLGAMPVEARIALPGEKFSSRD